MEVMMDNISQDIALEENLPRSTGNLDPPVITIIASGIRKKILKKKLSIFLTN